MVVLWGSIFGPLVSLPPVLQTLTASRTPPTPFSLWLNEQVQAHRDGPAACSPLHCPLERQSTGQQKWQSANLEEIRDWPGIFCFSTKQMRPKSPSVFRSWSVCPAVLPRRTVKGCGWEQRLPQPFLCTVATQSLLSGTAEWGIRPSKAPVWSRLSDKRNIM